MPVFKTTYTQAPTVIMLPLNSTPAWPAARRSPDAAALHTVNKHREENLHRFRPLHWFPKRLHQRATQADQQVSLKLNSAIPIKMKTKFVEIEVFIPVAGSSSSRPPSPAKKQHEATSVRDSIGTLPVQCGGTKGADNGDVGFGLA